MVSAFYFVVFVLSLIMLISFLIRWRKVESLFITFCIMVTLNCMGRYLISVSESVDMAICGMKILYVGACYTPLAAVFVLARLCDHKIPKLLKVCMLGYSSVVMGLVLTIGRCGLYYKTIELEIAKECTYMKRTYGPLHGLYPIMLLIYAVIMFGYLIYAIKKRKQLSFRLVVTLAGCTFAIMMMYILERILKPQISILAVGYLIGIALVFNYFERLNIYDLSANIINTVEKMKEYGYFVLDNKIRYINSNPYIREIFPEVKNWSVDREVPKSDSLLYREVVLPLKQGKVAEKNKINLMVGERYFDIEIRVISYEKKKNVGYLLEFIDRTIEKRYYNTIEDYNSSLEKEVRQKTENILHIKDMMVLGMADMVESRDNSTGGHIKRTSAVVKVFAERLEKYSDSLGLDSDFLRNVVKAAPMHDLGKISIDDVILRKPGKYTEEEFAKMKKHAEEGAQIVVNILQGIEDESFIDIARNVANFHHEKWNGKGYPQGLWGEQIPVEARIMALADVFDALVSKRCYKEAFSFDQAFQIIEESLGEHFDPRLGRIFMECRKELEEVYSQP